MRKLLMAFALMLACAPAYAGSWNLRQKDDGGAYWRNSDGREAHVLETHIVMHMTDITLPSTHYIVSPITGYVEKIYGIIYKAVASTDAVISSWVSNATRGATFTTEITNGTSRMTFPNTTSTAGDTITFTPSVGNASNKVSKGGRIAIQTDGGPTDGGVPATFVIVINPK